MGKDIVETTNETYAFPDGAVKINASNIVTVLHDNMGMEEAQADREPAFHWPYDMIIIDHNFRLERVHRMAQVTSRDPGVRTTRCGNTA